MTDEIEYRFATTADKQQLIDFLNKHFMPIEPTNVALGVGPEDPVMVKMLEGIVNVCVSQPISPIAVVGDAIVGVRLWCVLEAEREDKPAESIPEDTPANTAALLRYLVKVESGFKDIPKVKLAKLHMLAVDQAFSRRGIANKLIEMTLDKAKGLGCVGAVATATNFRTQLLFKKNHFSLVHEVLHKDFVDADGSRIITCADETDKGQLVYLEF